MSYTWTVVDECELIGPGHRRQGDAIHMGYWTPELVRWRDLDGYKEIQDLQMYNWVSGVKITGVEVNASPVLCITKQLVGHEDLTVSVTGLLGTPYGSVTSGDIVLTGYTRDWQYNQEVYRRRWKDGEEAGVFPATYNFMDDTVGENPTGMNISDAGGTVNVIAELGGHKKVVEMDDTVNGAYVEMIQIFTAGSQTTGTVEFWIYGEDVSQWLQIWLRGASTPGPLIAIDADKIKYSYGGWHDATGGGLSDNTWYHFKFVFNCNGGVSSTYDFYLNGVLLDADIPFNGDQTGLERLYFRTEAVGSNYKFYIDALGYSWDDDYNVGDNLEDGLNPFTYEFTIPAHTKPGKVYKLPSKRIYKLTDVNVSPQRIDQPLTDIRFYALADNGSKLLYTLNWNKIFEYGRENLYSTFGHPNKCPRCKGTGYVAIETNTCIQCSGFAYHGPNATGYFQIQKGKEFGLTQESGETDDTFRNKIWAMNWAQNLVPTQEEIQRYYGHFARIQNNEIEITRAYRNSGPTGIEVIVDLYLPQQVPLAVFDTSDYIWTRMAERIEPGGVQIRFSFAIQALTGTLDFEDMISHYRSGYIAGVYTGLILDPHTYGFDQLQTTLDTFGNQFENQWGEDYFMINLLPTGLGGLVHKSGDDAESGYQMLSGDTYTWQSGLLTGHAWFQWSEPASGNAQGGIWDTGGNGIIISEFYDINNSGTYYWDNFWASGIGAQGIQY